MNTIRRFHRLVSILAASACALLALAAASPAMAATARVPHYPPSAPPVQVPAPIHIVASGGMPGWQITLIAVGAAFLAGVLAVTADRARTARQRMTAPSL